MSLGKVCVRRIKGLQSSFSVCLFVIVGVVMYLCIHVLVFKCMYVNVSIYLCVCKEKN